MNNTKLKDLIRKKAKEKQVNINMILRLYMYDRFVERLSVSKYKDNFILKGGFYLSTLFGIENRATMDIDMSLSKTTFSEDNIIKMLKEIFAIDLEDAAELIISNISPIKEEDEYGGYRITTTVKINNIKESFHIDIATGDSITPKEIIYNYLPVLENKVIKIWAYNIETVLAEKIETILSRMETNTRTRDYYDVYLIVKMYSNRINDDHLKKAVEETFKKRKYNNDIDISLSHIKNSEILKERWIDYSSKNLYAKGVEYDNIVECLEYLINKIKR